MSSEVKRTFYDKDKAVALAERLISGPLFPSDEQDAGRQLLAAVHEVDRINEAFELWEQTHNGEVERLRAVLKKIQLGGTAHDHQQWAKEALGGGDAQ